MYILLGVALVYLVVVIVAKSRHSERAMRLYKYLPFLTDKRPQDVGRAQLVAAVVGLASYERFGLQQVLAKKQRFFRLPEHQQKQAIKTYKRYMEVEQKVQANSRLFQSIVAKAKTDFQITAWETTNCSNPASSYEVYDILNHLVRDYGQGEHLESQTQLFEPVLNALVPCLNPGDSVLLPGAGVGGLAAAIKQKFPLVDVEALEFSATMLLAGRYAISGPTSQTVFPYIHEFSHLAKASDQLVPVDLKFQSTDVKFRFGDFLLPLDTQRDAIVTLFFIDTAENCLDYLEQIAKCVKPGGTWINYGPLKWGTRPRIEFSMDELLEVIRDSKDWQIDSLFTGSNRYTGTTTSLWDAKYRLQGWKATRL